jgi:integrase
MNPLRRALREYLAARRSLGFKLEWDEVALRDFLSFLERHGASVITTKLAVQWAILPVHARPAHWKRRLGIVHRFAEYRSASDPRTEIPAHGLLPFRRQRRDAYIYGEEEIVRLMQAAQRLRSKNGLRAWTYPTVLGLMAVTGLRACEIVALDRADVDLVQGVLTVRLTKFGKSRLVPVHVSTQHHLQRYARQRDRIHPRSDTSSFFLSDHGARLSYWAVHRTFLQLSRQIALRGLTERRGPRLHDLRHRFAVQTLANWYRDGADVERRLPSLSVYLGHASVVSTYWYLTATPELLRLAAGRLDGPEGGPQS